MQSVRSQVLLGIGYLFKRLVKEAVSHKSVRLGLHGRLPVSDALVVFYFVFLHITLHGPTAGKKTVGRKTAIFIFRPISPILQRKTRKQIEKKTQENINPQNGYIYTSF